MSEPSPDQAAREFRGGFLACAWLFLAALLSVAVLSAPIAFWLGGSKFLESLVAAFLVCTVPGLVSLALVYYFAMCRQPLSGLVLSMGCRMLPPLAVCLWLALQGVGRDSIVFVTMLLLTYCLALAVETILSLRIVTAFRT